MTNRSSGRIGDWRKLVGILEGIVILGLPFVTIKGQSALRFDVPSLRLHFFGITLFMDQFFIVLVASVFVVFLLIFVTLLFGRIWCGWVCPQTVLIDYTRVIDNHGKNGAFFSSISYSVVLVISAVVSANLIWYFISPYVFFERFFQWRLGQGIWELWIVLAAIIFLDYAFLRHKWCSTVCPYAKLQSVMFDEKSLVIAFDPGRKEECMNCMACVKSCPVGIDIRKGPDAACINCAACIDRCTMMMKPKKRKSLVGYFWGLPGGVTKGILRTNALLAGLLAAAAFLFLIYLVMARTTLELTVLPNSNFYPRIVNKTAVNSYILSIRNRGESDEEVYIAVEGLSNGKVIPDKFLVKKDGENKIPVYVTEGNPPVRNGIKSVEMKIESKISGTKTAQKINFIVPSGG